MSRFTYEQVPYLCVNLKQDSAQKYFFGQKIEIAKVSSVHCSTSGLALGSPGCSLFVTMPKIPYNAISFKSQGSKDIKNDILDC